MVTKLLQILFFMEGPQFNLSTLEFTGGKSVLSLVVGCWQWHTVSIHPSASAPPHHLDMPREVLPVRLYVR